MNPDTLQNQGGAPQNPKILSLTKAIGKAESGGDYEAVGDNGNSQGAYQMTPDFISNYAPLAGVQYSRGQKLDMESQNKIAYKAVETMANQNLSPAQIASKWNTGNPDAYLDPNYGQNNAYGSTKNYVAQVEKYANNPQYPNTSTSAQVDTSASSMPSADEGIGGWIKENAPWLLPVGAALGVGAGVIGANLLAPEVAIPAEIAAGAAAPGILSKIFSGAKTAIKNLPATASEGYVINKLLGGDTQPQQSGQVQSQPQSQQNLSDLIPQMGASKNLYNAYQESAQGTQTGRAMLQDSNMQKAILSASIAGRGPDTSSGFNDFSQAEIERRNEAQAAAKMEKAIVGEGKANTSEAAKIAALHIPSNATPIERKSALKYIKQQAESYGKTISLSQMVNARHQQYASTKGKYGEAPKPSAQIMAHKALAKGFREAIKNHAQDKDLYEKILAHQRNLKNEGEVYKKLEGKKSPSANQFTKNLHRFTTRLAATYVGDKIGGVLGALVGNVILDIGQKSADKRFGQNVFDSPKVKAAVKVLHETMPKQYSALKAEMEKKGIKFPKEESEDELVREMKKGGVSKSEKILTKALNMSKEDIIRKKNPSALSNAIKNAKGRTKYRPKEYQGFIS